VQDGGRVVKLSTSILLLAMEVSGLSPRMQRTNEPPVLASVDSVEPVIKQLLGGVNPDQLNNGHVFCDNRLVVDAALVDHEIRQYYRFGGEN
jgi:hypothetical protein